MPEAPSPSADAYAAFRLPDYRAFWVYRLFGSSAIQIQSVAVGWQIYRLAREDLQLSIKDASLMLGLIGLAEAIPALGVSLFAGHAADVMSRRTILLVSNALLFFATAALAALSLPALHGFLAAHLWLIYLVIFLTGLCRGFLSPAHFGLLGQIVPPELYGSGSAWNSNAWQTACIGGPAIAGYLYGFNGPAVTYGLAGLLLLAGFLCLTAIGAPPSRAKRPEQSIFASIHEGLRFVFRSQIILGSMTLDLFAVLFGGAVALLPIYADEILHVGATGLGFLRAAPAVGSTLVGVYLSHRPVTRRAGPALMWNVAGFGVAMILFGLSKSFWLSLLWLFLSGGFDAVSVFVRWTMFQIVTPDHMKGRVAAVSSIFVGSSNEIGEFESGVMAKLLGTVPSVVFGGCMTLLVVAATSLLAPKLSRLDLSTVKHEP
ncbi:MAG TPA: MFS transporter [Opitutales bacterium]|nr:MFS transporter [Opitutales bacterium]